MASDLPDSNKDDLLVAALARGATQARAAEESGHSERTVRRRLENEKFRSSVQAARREALQRAVGAMATGAPGAVSLLLRLMTKAESESVRLGSAKVLLDQLPVRKMLDELAELPEAPIIEIILGDWRKEFKERLKRGDVLSAKAPDAKKPGGGSKKKSRRGSKKKSRRGSKKDDGSKQGDKSST